MPLITLFSAPKPFTDRHIAMIQRNAIKSWTLLPNVEVILLGEEDGLAEAAHQLGVRVLPHVARNTNGTPLISSMINLARKNSTSLLLSIINADVILQPDFVESAKQVLNLETGSLLSGSQKQASGLQSFVLLSQRWDLDVTQPIEFTEGWQERLCARVKKDGELHKPAGSDFFIFPLSSYPNVPDFAIGRAGWDNWMIYKARQEKWPVIDCTPSMMAIHQNHDYSHLPGGQPHYLHPETEINTRLAGGQAAVRYSILDATARFGNGKLTRPTMSYLRFMRGVELFLRAIFFFLPENMIENVARPKRWKKRIQKLFK